MNYELKDKISATTELLNELEVKCWQEIDHLQAQITNLANGPVDEKLRMLFKNLLTSYYVFTGGIETLLVEPEPIVQELPNTTVIEPILDTANGSTISELEIKDQIEDLDYEYTDVSEPFEYFVDFDEPVGDPLTDQDLYDT